MNPDQPMKAPTDYIGKNLAIQIDRAMGSRHPQLGFVYPVNYGFLPGVFAADGEELDAYLLGVFEPVPTYKGVCIAVIHRLDDDDDKLIIVPEGVRYSKSQIRALTEFQERFFTSKVLTSPTAD